MTTTTPVATANPRMEKLAAQPLVVIGAPTHAVRGTWKNFRDIFAQREMLSLLIRRDLKSRYKDSALGFVWSLMRPLTQLFIYYVVLGKFLGASRGIPDFAIYVYTGLTAYALFSEILAGSTGSIVNNSGLIKKVYVPREVFPLASIGSALFNFLIQFCILIAATLVTRQFPVGRDLLYLIPAIAVIILYSAAIGLALAAFNVYLRDIQYVIEIGLMVVMWGSPIVYRWSQAQSVLGHSWLGVVYTNNPLTLAVMGMQKAIWIGGKGVALYPDHLMTRLGIAGLVGVVLLLVAQRIFARLQGNFAQEL